MIHPGKTNHIYQHLNWMGRDKRLHVYHKMHHSIELIPRADDSYELVIFIESELNIVTS